MPEENLNSNSGGVIDINPQNAEANNQGELNQSLYSYTPRPNQRQVFGKSELLDAGKILSEILGLSTGKIVANLGAGGGMFTLQSARLVGEQGQVYAVDILKSALSDIDSKARMAGLHNIKTVWSNLEIVGAAKINDGLADFGLLINVLFQSKKHYEILAEAARILKNGGKLLVIDWSNGDSGLIPPSDMLVNPEKTIATCAELGLVLEQQFRAGQYHFGMIFIKQ
jgi:SAM-dependent methyltransferase